MIAPSEKVQGELLKRGGCWAAKFEKWVHTPNGRLVADRFIRIAYGCRARGIELGSKAIWERLRWNFMLRKQPGERFKLNNNFTPYMARFAVQREPMLADYFEFRESEGDTYVYKKSERSVCVPDAGGEGEVRQDAGTVCDDAADIAADAGKVGGRCDAAEESGAPQAVG